MLPDRSFEETPVHVTLALVDGALKRGRMRAFSPAAPEQRIQLSGAGGAPVPLLLPTEQIAFVGFHRRQGETREPAPGAVPVRIHLAGAGHIVVHAVPDDLRHPLGFYSIPWEKDSPYSEIFFYAYGVDAKVRVEPLGEMLLRKRLVAPVELERGLDEQSAGRSIPVGQILIEQEAVSASAVEDAAHLQKRVRMRIGEVLVDSGLATHEQVERALSEQKKRGDRRLGQVLVELGVLTENDLGATLAEKFHLPFVDLDELQIDPGAATRVPREIVEKFGVLPVRADNAAVVIATSDPLATGARDALRKAFPQRRIEEVLAAPTQLHTFVQTYLDRKEQRADEELQRILEQLPMEPGSPPSIARDVEIRPDISDSAVIRLVNQIIIDAYKRGASDIHVEPNGTDRATMVRLRVDGECAVYQELPATVRASLVARMKIIAGLDISERRKPQDGKIRFRFHDRMIELRVATIPTVNGNEDVVMRILAASKPLPLDQLALSSRNFAELSRLIRRPYGLVLCVGPTGSGKTTTLHSALGSINTPDMKIWTAEDPVEITQPGLRQVQVQPRIDFTFAAAMRAFLRADPDVIMVGEMRDAETAGMAVEASLTGHLVLSTLHTNSAAETVSRLIDMGVDPFTFADALLGVLAQRLTRALCPSCRTPHETSREEYEALVRGLGQVALSARGLAPSFPTFRARGCDACEGTGYKGRVALHELLVVSDELRSVIQRKGAVDDVRKLAVSGGMVTLLQDGLDKALAGKTDLRQVLAACSR